MIGPIYSSCSQAFPLVLFISLICPNNAEDLSVMPNNLNGEDCPVYEAVLSESNRDETLLSNGSIIVDYTYPDLTAVGQLIVDDLGKEIFVWPKDVSKFALADFFSLYLKTSCLDARKYATMNFSNLYWLDIESIISTPSLRQEPIIGLVDNLFVFKNNYTNRVNIHLAKEPKLLLAKISEYFPNLKTLRLRRNSISDLDDSNAGFSQMSHLEYVDLSDNLIEEIPAKFFNFIHWVKTVDLLGNPMRKVGRSAFSNVSMVKLTMVNNSHINLNHLEGVGQRVVLQFDKSALNVKLYTSSNNYIDENRFLFPELEFMGSSSVIEPDANDYKMVCPSVPASICKIAGKVYFSRLCLQNVDKTLTLGENISGNFDVCSNIG